MIDFFGRKANSKLKDQALALTRIETTIANAVLELRLLRALHSHGNVTESERFSIEDRKVSIDENYVRTMAWLLVAQENVRFGLNNMPIRLAQAHRRFNY